MEQFDLLRTSHLVFKHAFFLGVEARGGAEVSTGGALGLRAALCAEALPRVVSLVLVVLLRVRRHAACLGQAPSREVLLSRRVHGALGDVTARTHLHRGRRLQLEAVILAALSSETEGVLGVALELRFVLRLVLGRAWVLL